MGESATMAQNGPRILVQRLKVSRIAHFSQNFGTLKKLLKIGLKMGSFLKNGDPSGKTDDGIEFAVSENPILDTSHADLGHKNFWLKILRRG